MSNRPSSDLNWTITCGLILLLPLAYTYLVSALTLSQPPPLPYIPTPKQLGQARKRRLDQRQLEARQRRLASNPFLFSHLPTEIRILILQRCAEWPATVSSLVRVSRDIQTLTYASCLSLLPIRLIEPHHIDSFDLFLEQKPSLAGLINHLWVTPLHDNYVATATRVLKRCTNLVSLACTGRMLQDGVTSAFRGYKIHHPHLRELSLLYTDDKGWNMLLYSPSAIQFFKQLTHLRLVGDSDRVSLSTTVTFPRLIQISYMYNTRNSSESFSSATALLMNKLQPVAPGKPISYPVLQSVILVRERTYGGTSVRMWRKSKADDSEPDCGRNVFVFEIPNHRTELDLWCDNVLGRGFWQLAQ